MTKSPTATKSESKTN